MLSSFILEPKAALASPPSKPEPADIIPPSRGLTAPTAPPIVLPRLDTVFPTPELRPLLIAELRPCPTRLPAKPIAVPTS